MDTTKLHKVYKSLVSAGLLEERAMKEAVRICQESVSTIPLNSTEQVMYDSLVKLSGRARLGAIRENASLTRACTNGRVAPSTAGNVMNALIRKGMVKREGNGSQSVYVAL